MGKAEIPTLKQKIKARLNFLEKVLPFVKSIATQYGEVQKTQASSYTRITAKLTLDDFSFLYDGGQTMFGGNTVKVWYHPETPDPFRGPVLDLYWQTNIDQCEVSQFDETVVWRTALQRLMRNPKKIGIRIKQMKENAKAQKDREYQRAEQDERIRANATRLGL